MSDAITDLHDGAIADEWYNCISSAMGESLVIANEMAKIAEKVVSAKQKQRARSWQKILSAL